MISILRYSSEKREAFEKPYVKVFISDASQIENVAAGLSKLEEVRKVNITHSATVANSSIKSDPKPSLTIYPSKFYSADECLLAVNEYLNSFQPNVVEHTLEKSVKPHFVEIEQQILTELDAAKAIIDVCVAWFTNEILRDKLLEKQSQGVRVRVIIYDDGINARSGVDLTGIQHKELPAKRKGTMHKKYCVIDNSVVISGSYNWTNNAEHRNDEDITIERNDIELASSFTRDFNDMWRE